MPAMRELVRILLITLLVFLLATVGLAQDADDAAADAAETETAAEDASEAEDDEPPVTTDNESYLDIDEEDFRPSEEIPADQSITFPTDI